MDSEPNPYELLDILSSTTDQEIKTAYRKKSLKVHPDRNPNNPEAAEKFHQLNQAYELLLDPLRRLALDAKLRTAQAKKERFQSYDKKRKEMVEELEQREREFKRQRMEKGREQVRRREEEDRIKEAGRKMREQAELARKQQAEQGLKEEEDDDVPELGPLDTTIRIKYQLSSHPTLTTQEALASLFSQFGELDPSLIVLKLKKKSITALISFKQLVHAFAAVNNSNQAQRGLHGIEVAWATGKGDEPALLKWLKKMGKLDTRSIRSLPETKSDGGARFSSFPETPPPPPPQPEMVTPGLDFENLTLLRLRQAERERIEREILEAEAREEEGNT